MSEQKDGGPAFPCEQHETSDGTWNQTFGAGMTLRDYFAAKAMQALIGTGATIQVHREDGLLTLPARRAVPRLAYEYADAMLAAREQQP